LEFPCTFPIKVIGTGVADFERIVLEIVPRHVPAWAMGEVESRPSGAGTYLAVTVTFTATSQEQIDGLYRELSAHERVVMVL
jgi:putative lipoic acid-binding regulatory protein